MPSQKRSNPMDELLRARLRVHEGADLRIAMLRKTMQSVDVISRVFSGQPFFSFRETEEALVELGDRQDVALINALLARNGGTRITAHGLQNIPREGPIIIGSTHPIGTFDFISHAAVLLDHRPDLRVVANREVERFLGVERIIPVDFDRKDKVLTARQTREGMLEHLNRGGALLVFGSGKVPDMRDGLLFEPTWKSGITRMSKAGGAPIVPASPNMRNSTYYYRTRKIARILSGGNEIIGRDVASLRYVSELLAKLGGNYEIFYGAAQPPGTSPEDLKHLAEGLVPGLYQPK